MKTPTKFTWSGGHYYGGWIWIDTDTYMRVVNDITSIFSALQLSWKSSVKQLCHSIGSIPFSRNYPVLTAVFQVVPRLQQDLLPLNLSQVSMQCQCWISRCALTYHFHSPFTARQDWSQDTASSALWLKLGLTLIMHLKKLGCFDIWQGKIFKGKLEIKTNKYLFS